MRVSDQARRPLPWLAALCVAAILTACGGEKPEAMLGSARDYLAKNDPKAAIIQIKNALQANPDLGEARLLLGRALLQTGDPVGAETELRKAQALKYADEQVVPELARALLAQRQFKKLVDEFGATELPQPAAQANLKTSIAAAQSALGKSDLSDSALKAALAADPGYGPALTVQARLMAAKKDFPAALAQVESILAKTPNDADAWKLKGDLLSLSDKDTAKAMAAYRKALEVKPDHAASHAAILNILVRDNKLADATTQLEALKKVAPQSPQANFYDAMIAYQKGDIKAAREKAQQLVRVAGNVPQALQLAGTIELQSGALLQADALLSKALQLAPSSPVTRRLLATVQLRSGQSAKAMSTVAPILKQDSLDAATYAVIGEVFLQNGDPKQAEEYFAKSSKLDPGNEKTRTSLALTHLAAGRDEAGLAELQQIASGETGNSATLALISAHLRRGEYDKALKVIDLLDKKPANKAMAANLRGRTLLAKKDVAGARKAFEQSLTIDPTYFASVASLAAMDMADKKPEDARKRFEAVLAKDPKNGQALVSLAELRLRTGGSKAEVIDLLNKAVSANPTDKTPRLLLVDFLLRNKEAKDAVAAAVAGVAALPDSPEMQDALGRAQLDAGDANQALTAFNKAAAMQPLSPAPLMRLADAYLAMKNKDGAAQNLRKALAIKPDLLDAQRGLIMLAVDSKNYEEGLRMARTIQKQSPKEPTGYQFESDILAVQKNYDAAAEALRVGLKAVNSPVLAVRLHTMLQAAGKAADAEKWAGTWIKDNPKDAVFRMYQGETANMRKDYAGAEKAYLGVLQLDPRNAIAMNNLAWALGKQKKDGAIAYAEKAIALSPQQPAYLDTLAELYSDKGDYAKALEWQTKAVGLAPGNGVFRINLAKIHIKGGQKDLARKELEALAKLGDKFPGQAEVAKLLKEL